MVDCQLIGLILTKMSKYFTENFVHGDEAILSEKWPFWSLVEALPD